MSDLRQRLREAEDKNKMLKSKLEGHEVQGSAFIKTKVSLLNIHKNSVNLIIIGQSHHYHHHYFYIHCYIKIIRRSFGISIVTLLS